VIATRPTQGHGVPGLHVARRMSRVQVAQASACREDHMSKDPVCGMTIDEKTAAGTSEYEGKTYYFCAPICKTKFDQAPAKYVAKN
jgi:YHS domain-containing protein